MPMVYDNWERLVFATLDREKLRQLALAPSRETSFNSSISSSTFNSAYDFLSDFSSASFNSAYDFQSDPFTDYVSGSVTDRVVEAAENARRFKEECAEIKSKAEKLAGLLRQVKRTTATSNGFYELPGRRIVPEAELALEKALKLLLKCRRQGVRRVFNIIPAGAFGKMSSQLGSSIGDVSWLLRVSASSDDRADEYLGLPSIAVNEPILCLIWEQIAILYTDSLEDRADAAASLVSLARDNDRYAKLIIEEDGVRPLLKLVEEGRPEGQENAAKAIGILGKGRKSVEYILDAGACQVFVKTLERGHMRVQAMVAWAVSELAAHNPECQQTFAEHGIIPLLVKIMNLSLSGEMEDPATKENIKIMAAKALWQLAKANSQICKCITDTRALLSFAALLERGPEELQYNSAMALLEITALAEIDVALRMSVFSQNLSACKAVVDQLLRLVEKAKSEALLIPCIKIIGNLCTTRATDTRTIIPLVKLLDGRENKVSREVCITLSKFACSENAECLTHSKAIVDAGGAKYLVDLLYFGDDNLQICALILLCHIIKHVPENEQLAKVELLIVLEWAWNQSFVRQDKDVEKLLPEAKERLKLCIPRIMRIAIN